MNKLATVGKGYRTIIFNVGLVVVVALLNYVVKADWSAYLTPANSLILVGIANVFLRAVTDTPVGKKE